MIYTIDNAMDEFHKKDLKDRLRYCFEKQNRICENCYRESCELHPNYKREEPIYRRTVH